MPVVMVSTLTERGAEVTLRALELGAIDFVAKPKIGVADGLRQLAEDITDKIRIAAQARVQPAAGAATGAAAAPAAAAEPPRAGPAVDRKDHLHRRVHRRHRGHQGSAASTCRPTAPAVMITQHMPPGFTTQLCGAARRPVPHPRRRKPSDGERVLPGHAYIAPGGLHLSVERSGANYVARVQRRRAGQPPQALGRGAVPVGRARGRAERARRDAHRHGRRRRAAMRAMRDAGSWNLAQDEASCVVFGMPGGHRGRRGARGAAAACDGPPTDRAPARHGWRRNQQAVKAPASSLARASRQPERARHERQRCR